MVLIDEAYHHFVSDTAAYRSFLDHPLDNPRIIVARTFSKIHGLAGLRIGYSVFLQRRGNSPFRAGACKTA